MAKSTRNTKVSKAKKFFGVLDNTIRDHKNDPFVVKKNKEAKRILKLTGLPNHLFKAK